jgi:hypothetical protein
MLNLLKWLVSFVDKNSGIIRLQSIYIAGDSSRMTPQGCMHKEIICRKNGSG